MPRSKRADQSSSFIFLSSSECAKTFSNCDSSVAAIFSGDHGGILSFAASSSSFVGAAPPQRHLRELSWYVCARWSWRTACSGAGFASTDAANAGSQSCASSSVNWRIASSRTRNARAASGQRSAFVASRSISSTLLVTVRGRFFRCAASTSFHAFSKSYSAIAAPFSATAATSATTMRAIPLRTEFSFMSAL